MSSFNRRNFLKLAAAMSGLSGLAPWSARAAGEDGAARRPNIVWIMADDLGYGELGCQGQRKIKTPRIDRLAAEGIRFTQAYCGTSVCAPSRCTLMTGLHTGHAPIRGNRELREAEGQKPMPADTFTVAHLLKQAGYATACIGKWGLGHPGSASTPDKMGFDHFFGYNCQRMAHNYYPAELWRDGERVKLDGKTYSHDLMAEDALAWVDKHADGPFFLYFALTIPHAQHQVPDLAPYGNEAWPEDAKRYAAMITRMDGDIGRLMDLLKRRGVDENTLVVFVSDNGWAGNVQTPGIKDFFGSGGGLRDIKRSMYEGGLRVPAIARWPRAIKPGQVSDAPWAFWDFLPTAAEIAGAPLPAGRAFDGVSILPLLRGQAAPKRDTFYWELHEGPMKQALRQGDWKVVRNRMDGPVELYNLKNDATEQHDLAASEPEVAARLERLMRAARTDSPDWPAQSPRSSRSTKVVKR